MALNLTSAGPALDPVVSWSPGDIDATQAEFEPYVACLKFQPAIRILDTHEYITGPVYSPSADKSTWGQFGPVTAYDRIITSRQTMLDDFNQYFRFHLGAVPGDDLDNVPPDPSNP